MDMQPNIVVDPRPIAPAGPVGLAATALANFAVAVSFCGWGPAEFSIGYTLFTGGLAQFVAGLWEYRRGNTLGTLGFMSYGAWWTAIAINGLIFATKSSPYTLLAPETAIIISSGIAWLMVCIFIANTFMLLASFQKDPVSIAVFFFLGISTMCLFIGQFLQPNGASWIKAGGALQVVLAAVCFYAMFGQMFNHMAGREIVPFGRPVLNFAKKDI